MEKSPTASPMAKVIYGFQGVSTDSWLNYAYALMTVAGADGEVSEAEMDWMIKEFLEIIEAPPGFKKHILEFDYKKADLQELLPKIKFDLPVNYPMALIYDAIKMSRADHDFALKEQEAVKKMTALLEIPYYMARTVEGLVSTEQAIEETRKSVFEVEEVSHPKMMSDMRPASVMVRHTFGINMTNDETQLCYGQALMTIAGADGKVSPKERNWYKYEFAQASKVPENVLEEVLAFDYQKGDIEALVARMRADVSINFSRTLLYNAIKMSRADKHYALEEQDAVNKAADLLNISENTALTLEYLIDTEEKVEKMRKLLFGISAV